MSELSNIISRYVKLETDNLPYLRMPTAIIISHGNNGYTISLDGLEYPNIKVLRLEGASKTQYSVGDTVVVKVTNRRYDNMFILGKLSSV